MKFLDLRLFVKTSDANYIALFKSPRDKQQILALARQVNHGHIQEFMKSYEDGDKASARLSHAGIKTHKR